MKYVVPQFIDVEDKIIGPITARQFVILLVAAMLVFVFYKTLDFMAFAVASLLLAGVAGVIAFIRVNGQPFHFFLLNAIQTLRRPGLRIWDKNLNDAELKELLNEAPPPPPAPRLRKAAPGARKLSELSLVVNTGGIFNPDES